MYSDWDSLRQDCLKCTKCALSETRTQVVFGGGNSSSEILFIGEAPGEKEDLKGEPFVGRAGQLLDKMLLAVDLSRQKIFIANIVKCRPPKNRDPLPEEQDACIEWLREQVKIFNPKIIVCLGRISGMKIIKPDLKITREHGVWFDIDGIYTMAMLHPAALLRNPALKPEAYEDFLTLRKKIDEVFGGKY